MNALLGFGKRLAARFQPSEFARALKRRRRLKTISMGALGYSKMSQNAIAAMSYLAEHSADGEACFSSATIAEARGLSQSLVAKILTTLSQSGQVVGSPGPKGGYRLARPAHQISFHDVAQQFDRMDEQFPCPFGAEYCPNDNPCPVHDELMDMRETVERFLKDTHFGTFVAKTDTLGP